MSSWHYEKDGQRQGPASETQMGEMIQRRELNGSTLVWTEGMADWGKLDSTELKRYLAQATTPPPLPGSRIPNGIVWVLAVAPLIGLFLESMVAGAMAGDSEDVDYAVALAIASGTYWYITLGLNVGLGLLDERRLRKAGVDTSGFGKIAFLIPVYLWKRAEALKQSSGYFWVWIATFILAILVAVGTEQELQADGSETDEVEVAQVDDGRRSVDQPAASRGNTQDDGLPVSVIQIRDNRVATLEGSLFVATEDQSGVGPKVLFVDDQILDGITDDHITLLTLYRYPGRDVLIFTHACAGSGCGYTSVGLLEFRVNGPPWAFRNKEWTINTDDAKPDVKAEPDGSLIVTIDGFSGRQSWRYHDRKVTRL